MCADGGSYRELGEASVSKKERKSAGLVDLSLESL